MFQRLHHIQLAMPLGQETAPRLARADYLQLAGPAEGIMLVGFAEGLGAAKTYAARDSYQISPNRELFGLGAADVGVGLSSGMVVNGSLSKTAVSDPRARLQDVVATSGAIILGSQRGISLWCTARGPTSYWQPP